jgi:hypothetical protein
MRELTDYERGFLRAAEKRGGEWTIEGNYDHHKWDHLVEAGYLDRRTVRFSAKRSAYSDMPSFSLLQSASPSIYCTPTVAMTPVPPAMPSHPSDHACRNPP